MRKFFLIGIGILAVQVLNAQTNKPNPNASVPVASQGPRPVPSSYSSDYIPNSVWTWEPQRPLQKEEDITTKGRTVEEVHRTIQYFDGLGRSLQTVAWQMSGGRKDLVTTVEYDAFGREQYKY